MKCYKSFFLLIFVSSMHLFSQEKYKQHTVAKGETISEIATHYKVNEELIYQLNPDAANGIKSKMILLVPIQTKKSNTIGAVLPLQNSEQEHEVLPKETLYSIAKLHKVSLEEIYKANPILEKEGLKMGQIIKIPQSSFVDLASNIKPENSGDLKKTNLSKANNSKEEENKTIPTEGIVYEILPKESLYSIAKKYSITIADLQKANPNLGTKSLKSGQKIIVPVKEESNSNLINEKVTKKGELKEQVKEIAISFKNNSGGDLPKIHEVLPNESLYSIAKQYGITLSDLKKGNPDLENNLLKVGQKINISLIDNNNSTLFDKNLKMKPEKEVAPVLSNNLEDVKPTINIAHVVCANETKYGIAKYYGITIAELEKQNPNISNQLLVGSVVKISTSKVLETSVPTELSVSKTNTQLTNSDFYNRVYDSAFVDQLISKASENIGTRYRSGGITTDGFDCSGLMCYTFGSYDIKLPRTSIEMAAYGSVVETGSAQKGDLIFFKTGGRSRINHVGMVVEILDGEIKFIHSSSSNGVMISSTKESYYEKSFAQVNRVLQTQL